MAAVTILEQTFVERSSGVITCSFRNELGLPITPKDIKWSLTDLRGNIINARDQVDIEPIGNTCDIVLLEDDLRMVSTQRNKKGEVRLLTVEAVYDSNLANDLLLKAACRFSIINLKSV